MCVINARYVGTYGVFEFILERCFSAIRSHYQPTYAHIDLLSETAMRSGRYTMPTKVLDRYLPRFVYVYQYEFYV